MLYIVFAGSVTGEFSKGSVIPLLTKGLSRTAFMLSKLTSALLTWSAGYWLCFGTTYGYTVYFWKDDSVKSILPAVLLWWLFSVMLICLMFLFASFASTSIQVTIGTLSVYFVMSLAGIADKIKNVLPTALTDSMDICTGKKSVTDILPAIVITAVITALSAVLSLVLVNKKKI